MKKLLFLFVALLLTFGCVNPFDDTEINNRLDDLEERIEALEELCKQMNTNITSLQSIVAALQNSDYITSVTPITENGVEIGYTITFAKSNPITIYHGQDGKDGANGTDGKDGIDGEDGYSPVIGVKQDTDGIYYWTLDGEWLLDENGNKIKAVGTDGKDGQDGADGNDGEDGKDDVDGSDGADGSDGKDGVDGKNGITPQLKIEEGYWYISYDNGATWTKLGKATGEDGKDGVDGIDGENGIDGDAMFKEIRQDEENVYFVLIDGTELKVPKLAPLSISFEAEDMVVMLPNSSRDIRYTIKSTSKEIAIEVLSSSDIKARVISETDTTGKIHVETSDVIDEYSKVVVLVSDDVRVIMQTILFEEEGLEVKESNGIEVSDEGGNISLYYLANTECEVIIPEESTWLHLIETKALQEHEIVLSANPNTGMSRSANVVIKSNSGLSLTYTITQLTNSDIQKQLEREALIALYNATDGDNWTNNENWCSDKPVSEWYGVNIINGDEMLLKLGDNNLCGEIPSEIGSLEKLIILDFFNNKLTGKIPETIGNLKKLQQLYLGQNFDLSGELPSSICNLTNLWMLNMTWLRDKVTLPENIGDLSNLRYLYLDCTDLEFPLPESMSKLHNLEQLTLGDRDRNSTGNFPGVILRLDNLKRLDIGGISGDIPADIQNLKSLEELWMNSEQESGQIPKEIGNLTNLRRLTLDFPYSSSSIPPELGNLHNLEYLHLYYQLEGTIPQELGNLKNIKYLSLENPFGDKLHGCVPESIQQLEYWPYFFGSVLMGHPLIDKSSITTIPAIDLSVIDIDGNPINTDDIYPNNKYTILFQWNEGCPATPEMTAILKDCYSKYSNEGLEIIAWSPANIDNTAYIREYVAKNNIPWRNFTTYQQRFASGVEMCPSFYAADIMVVNSKREVVFDAHRNNMYGVESFLDKMFAENKPEYYTSTDFSQHRESITLQEAKAGNGIDIVLMGDAYSDRLIADGTYRNVMEASMERLFSEEPYKSYRDYFNVYMINVVSENEVYDTYSTTALETWFGEGTSVGGNDNRVFSYALNAISAERLDEALIVVMMNRDYYAGTCYMYYPSEGNYGNGPSVAYFPTSSDEVTFAGLMLHEAGGHGFAKLDDEYAYEDYGSIPDWWIADRLNMVSHGWWKNTDFTDDVNIVKWAHFLADERYQYDGLGVFEGASTYWTGAWRPTENSIMRYNEGGFNAPSREAIYYRIHKLAYGEEWEYKYEDFVTYDEINRKTAEEAEAAQVRPQNIAPWRPTTPPVVVGKTWREAMEEAK